MSDGEKPYDAPVAGSQKRRALAATKWPAAQLFTMILVGTVIGGLIAKLGGYQFRLYVQTFQANSTLHTIIADCANVIRPVAWFFPLIFGVYQCVRSRASFDYVVLFGLIGGGIGWVSSGYIMASPGPNYHSSIYTVPIWCFLGTVFGAIIQIIRWPHDNEA